MPRQSKHASIPADFREFALAHSIRESRSHYGIGYPLFHRWCIELGIAETIRKRLEKRTEHRAIVRAGIPDGFREYALSHTVNEAREHFGIGHRLHSKWANELGIAAEISARVKNPCPLKEMPAGFADRAHLPNSELRDLFPGNSDHIFSRWRKQCAVKAMRAVKEEPAPADFRRTVASLYIIEACRHYDRSDNVIKRWARETGATFRAWTGWRGPKKAPDVDGRSADLAGQAQRHLQRIGPVFKRGDDYSVFGRCMPAPAMIEFAKNKGFDPKAWERIA
jgi:hypothetical protein